MTWSVFERWSCQLLHLQTKTNGGRERRATRWLGYGQSRSGTQTRVLTVALLASRHLPQKTYRRHVCRWATLQAREEKPKSGFTRWFPARSPSESADYVQFLRGDDTPRVTPPAITPSWPPRNHLPPPWRAVWQYVSSSSARPQSERFIRTTEQFLTLCCSLSFLPLSPLMRRSLSRSHR